MFLCLPHYEWGEEHGCFRGSAPGAFMAVAEGGLWRDVSEAGFAPLVIDTGAGNLPEPGALTFVRLPENGLVPAAEVGVDIGHGRLA